MYCSACRLVFTRVFSVSLFETPSPFSTPSQNVCAYIMLSLSPLFPAWVPLLHIAGDGEEEVVCSSPLDWHPIGGKTLF